MANKFYNNLISHWLMNDNLATTAVLDNKGSNDGVLTNAGNTEDVSVAGKINEALDFDGANDVINCGHDSSLSSEEFTFSAWVKPSAFGSYNMIMGQGSSLWQKYFWIGDSGHIRAYWAHTDTAATSQSSTLISLDEWTLVSVVFKNDTFYLYKNGEEVDYTAQITGIGTPNDYSALDFAIGATNNSSSPFTGKIDDVRIYDTAITADYVKLLYNAGAGTEDENVQHHNLVSHWLMNDDLATTAVLDTTGVNDGVLNGGDNTEDISVAGKINKALDFDETHTEYVNLNAVNVAGASAGSISVWIKSDGAWVNHDNIFYCGDGPAWKNIRFGLAGLSTNQIFFTVANGTSSISQSCSSGALSPDTWYHIVGTYDGSHVKIYVNGELKDTVESSIVPGAFTPTFTGIGYMNYSDRYWNGIIDDVRIYDTAISPYYVKLLYNNGAGTEDENIQSNTLLLGCNF